MIMVDDYAIAKWEGYGWEQRLGNRISGLCMSVFGAILLFGSDNTVLDIGGSAFLVEGVADFLSGKYHYISSRLLRYHPRYQDR